MDLDKNGFYPSCIPLYYEDNLVDKPIWDSVCLSTDIFYGHEFVAFLAERIKIRYRLLSIKVEILIILCLHHLNLVHFVITEALQIEYLLYSGSMFGWRNFGTHLFLLPSVGSCYCWYPIIPIILVRQRQGQLRCIHPSCNCSTSLTHLSSSGFLDALCANCTWRCLGYLLCHCKQNKIIAQWNIGIKAVLTVMRINCRRPLALRMPLNSPFSQGPLGSGISSQQR